MYLSSCVQNFQFEQFFGSSHVGCNCRLNSNKWKTQPINFGYWIDLNSGWVNFKTEIVIAILSGIYRYTYISNWLFDVRLDVTRILLTGVNCFVSPSVWCNSTRMSHTEFGEYTWLTFIVVSIFYKIEWNHIWQFNKSNANFFLM